MEEKPEPIEEEANSEEMADGMRVSFKEAMDSYEAFFDEYVAFMKKYQESENSLSMLADYMKNLEKYTDTMEKFEAWNDGTLNNAELKYYLDVLNRINQKILEIT